MGKFRNSLWGKWEGMVQGVRGVRSKVVGPTADRVVKPLVKSAKGHKLSYHHLEDDGPMLLWEIRKAKRDWDVACSQFDWATDADGIDYAVYMLEATEKRYEMLIRRAKRAKLSSTFELSHFGREG